LSDLVGLCTEVTAPGEVARPLAERLRISPIGTISMSDGFIHSKQRWRASQSVSDPAVGFRADAPAETPMRVTRLALPPRAMFAGRLATAGRGRTRAA
jgi:hypothetical protein